MKLSGFLKHILEDTAKKNKTDTVCISDENGKLTFTATLKNYESES